MFKQDDSGAVFYCFKELEAFDGVRHGIFTNQGGCSRGPFRSLNVGSAVGDDPGLVQKNRSAVASVMKARTLAFVSQVHGDRVVALDGEAPKGPGLVWNSEIEADAMITDHPGLFLSVNVADCQPVLLYDPVKKAVGAVHSGWKGSVLNIAGEAVEAMKGGFSTNPRDLIACIGPSLGPCCAEFVNYKSELPESFHKYEVKDKHFDFWAATRDQLLEAGLDMKRIHCAGICTKCGGENFFSYRRNRQTGRFAAVIGLKGKTD